MNAVNLIPADQRTRGRGVATGLPFAGLMLGLGVILIAAAMVVIGHNHVESRKSQLADLQAQTAKWSRIAGSYAGAVAASKQREATIGQVKSLVGQRADWSKLLGQLATVMPLHSQLSSLSTSVPGAASSAGSVGSSAGGSTSSTTPGGSAATGESGGSTIQISACASTQTVVAQTMVALRRISGVSQVSLASSGTGGAASSGSSGSAGAGSCGYPVSFSVTLAFDPPTFSSDTSTTQAASDTSATGHPAGVS